VHAEFGGLEVVRSGWVDLPLLLTKTRDYFVMNGEYMEAQFDVADLQIENDSLTWKNISFGKAVFCQGFMALQNDFFNWLPFAPVKGQILEIATESAVKAVYYQSRYFYASHFGACVQGRGDVFVGPARLGTDRGGNRRAGKQIKIVDQNTI
jgi:hypothetical protein